MEEEVEEQQPEHMVGYLQSERPHTTIEYRVQYMYLKGVGCIQYILVSCKTVKKVWGTIQSCDAEHMLYSSALEEKQCDRLIVNEYMYIHIYTL